MSTAIPTPLLAPRYVGGGGGGSTLQLLSALPSASSSRAQPAFLTAFPTALATLDPVFDQSDPVFDQTFLPYNWNSFMEADWFKFIVLFILAVRMTNTVFGMPLGVLPHPPRGPDDTPIGRLADQYAETKGHGDTEGGTSGADGGVDETGETGARTE